ncbi:ParB/RepB/Spo0J family partition protein [Cupriavidus sp. KK10]|jgi:ParB family chromosome partitioning protein|uniref:ParB/RepB/Spo0J family partition protein n=1 Tax=Cupriavidus sp. KK10 TaxID=1478019 RepID=UPI001BAB0BBC|nr:ParB/RepB/Spo0J family partition protein [Cupriavidus sp. KK10]QUN29519.1 ParB/RepB/Spo0J family partition protein [Cupriavidus sp. KK10]
MTTIQHNAVLQVPLSQLTLSPRNARQTSPKALNELAALLASQGQLQNLIVTKEIKDGAPTGRYEVIAGGRRWRAMQLLVERGSWSHDHPVDVAERAIEQAEEISLAENSAREAMHPADEFVAFKRLVDAGTAIEDVAARFGVSPLVVQRRLKLANVSPKMIQIYRDGEASLEQLMALAITDDPKAQERTWKEAANSWDRNPEALRRKLAKGEIEVRNSKLAKFVTLEAYEAAGGHVERDLFSDAGNGYLADSALLEQLASDKLEAAATEIRAEGWAWVEAKPDFEAYRIHYDYERLPSTTAEPSKAQKASIKALEKERAETEKAINQLEENDDYGDAHDEHSARLEAINDELAAIKQSQQQWSAEDKDRSGAILAITEGGLAQIHRGLVDKKKARTGVDDGEAPAKKPADKTTLSASLASRLTAHRTAALQLHLVEQPTLALAVLVHGMLLKLFRNATYKFATLSALDLSVSDKMHGLPGIADDLNSNPAWTRLQELRAQLLAGLPKADGALLAHLIALPQQDLLQLLALCTAASTSAVFAAEGPRAADAVAEATGLDMADWWSATADGYLSLVPKTLAIAAVTEACGKKAAAPLASMKKADLAANAEQLLAGTGWLPKILRGPKRAAPKATATNKPARPPVRYRDENGNTWTGRGKRPGWVEAALKAGKTLDELLAS